MVKAVQKCGGVYDVRVITLPKYDLFDTQLSGRQITFLNKFTDTPEPVDADAVYGILAAPTCTMFSLARNNAKTPRDFDGAMKLIEKCLEIIWYCRRSNKSRLKFWALENPRAYLRQFLGVPPFSFSPEEFGDVYTKPTDIWGYFNIPTKTHKPLPGQTFLSIVDTQPQLPDDYILPDGWTARAARRSMTSACFAEAFFMANK